MYQVNEYYQASKSFAKPTKHLGSFASLEEAKALADSASRELRRVPESENQWIGVLNEAIGRVVYGQPSLPDR